MRCPSPWLLLAALSLSLTPACGDKDDGSDPDGGSTDGESADGGTSDGGSTDSGSTDGGSTDGGGTDGGGTDTGSTDGGGTDTGSSDPDDDGDGWTVGEGDCDDADPDVHPDASEVCNDGVDDDCSGQADDVDPGLDTATATYWWIDGDSDGYGGSTGYLLCEDPSTDTAAYVTESSDCDDTRADVHPAATEICNDGVDDDCDGTADDDDEDLDTATASTWWLDADGDGFGGDDSTTACAAPEHYVDDDTDCDDTDLTVHPGATERCNGGVDDDCNGTADDADEAVDGSTASDWYTDGDDDGYGDAWAATACVGPEGTVDVDGDCDDADDGVYPGAPEVCDGGDQDCDGEENAAGAAGFTDGAGDWTDLTASVDGSSAAAEDWASTGDGTLHLCDGIFYTTLDLGHDVVVEGFGAVQVDARSSGTAVTVDGSGLSVTIRDLTIKNGYGDSALLSVSGNAGGGVVCAEGGSQLVLESVVVDDNTATYGGGLAVGDCSVELEGSTIEDNSATYGAGIYQRGGEVRLIDSTVEANVASNLGGGGVVVRDATESSSPLIELDGTYFLENSAGSAGALYLGDQTDGMCLGDTSSGGGAGFWGNETTGGGYGAVETYGDTTFVSERCDFGASGTSDDNGDVDVEAAGSGYTYGDDATFYCHDTTCT